MSRRSRRRQGGGGQAWMGKAAIVLVILCVIGAGVLYAAVRGYLHSENFRQFLSLKAGKALGVDGRFEPFRWDGLAVNSAGFGAEGKGPITELKVDGLHTEIGLGGLSRGVWEIRGSEVQRLEVSVDGRHVESVEEPPPTEVAKPDIKETKPGWLPSEVELQGLDVNEVVVKALLDKGPASVAGMRVRLEPTDGKQAYRIEASGGSIWLPFGQLPEIRLERARLRYQDRQVFLSELTASAWENARLEASGEWDTLAKRYAFEGGVSGVKCDDLFNETWAKRASGELASDFIVENSSGSPVARGELKLRNGVLTALPVLDALAAYADTSRFRVLTLSEAQTNWRWEKGEIRFTNLVIASEGLVRLEGNLLIRDRQLDGSFRLGLAPGTLASIPGAETDVFLPGERGLLWSPLRITGTLDDPKEDLTDRLIAAAGLRMFDILPETGEKVIKFSRKVLGDSPEETIEKGVEIIREGSEAVKEAKGVLKELKGLLDD